MMRTVRRVTPRSVGMLLVLGCVGACSHGAYFREAGYPPEIALSASERAFIMPVWVDMPGNATALGTAFVGGMVSACGDGCVPGQPLQPVLEGLGMQGLSYRVARAMYWGAVDGYWWQGEYAEIPGLLGQLLTQVNEAFPGANFRYIVVGDVWHLGAGRVPNTVHIRLLGGLYDIQSQRVATVFWSDETMPEDTLLANATIMGNRVIALATCPSDDCVDAAASASNVHRMSF